VRQSRTTGTLTEQLYPLTGHLGTSLCAIGGSGAVAEQVDGDAFGQLDAPIGLKQNLLYAGEYWDQDAQLLYLRARWYDPKIGRFVSADSLEGKQRNPRSLNRYAYAHSDPVHNTDASGKFSLMETSAASDIASTLSGLQVDFGINFLDSALNPGSNSAASNALLRGVAAIGGYAGFKVFKALSKRFRAKNLPEVQTIEMAHITGAHMTAGGKVTGYHTRSGGADLAGWTVKVTRGPDKNGVYEALVFFNGKAKKANGGKSTFFPDHWSEDQIQAEIMSAYMRSEGDNVWSGVSASGVSIKGFFEGGRITSAFPVLP
jgi:RHS repeat-associated protein